MAWETSSGLIERFTGTITDAYVEADTEYRGGDPVIYLVFSNLSVPETPQAKVPDELDPRYPVGSTFERVDRHTFAAGDGSDRDVNESSGYGTLINRIAGRDSADADLSDALEVLMDRGDEKDVRVWLGLRFTMQAEPFSFKTDDGEEVSYTRHLPVEFHGLDEDGTSQASGTTTDASSNGYQEQLEQLANTSDTHQEFMRRAMQIDGLVDDDDLFADVADNSDDGFYARHSA